MTLKLKESACCCPFSGVPAVVDFASMRDAVKRMGGDPDKINPVCPADLVIDHSVQVDIARRYEVKVMHAIYHTSVP